MSLWKKLLWIAVTLLGLGSIAILAMSRGEQISALWIVVAGLCAFAISYRFYSKWLASKVLSLNDQRATPALVQNDGKDFVPTNRWMVFGHHFAAIAGPGPLVGPVLAAQFGFLPGTLWILIGATLGASVVAIVAFFDEPKKALIVIIYFIVYQQIENYAVMPRIMQRTVAVPGAVTVVAALAGGALLGILGALLAIPFAAGALLLYEEVLVPRQRRH